MKAQIYSIIALLITIPVFIFIAYFITTPHESGKSVSDKIISDQISHIAKSVEKDFSKSIEISAKRAVLAMMSYIIENGKSMDNTTLRMKELMINGTLYGNVSYIMLNNTIPTWVERINEKERNFNMNLSHGDVFYNNTEFTMNVTSSITINISAGLKAIRIDREREKSVVIGIEGFEDPLFPLHTQGFVRRKIAMYPLNYTAIIIVNGTASKGSCKGNVTFSTTPDSNKILVIHNASGISGFLGVVSETTDIPNVPCYVTGASNAVQKINSTVISTGFWKIYIDNTTSFPNAVWHIPIEMAIDNGYYLPGHGPTYFMRFMDNMNSTQSGIESFVNIPELEANNIPVYDYSRIDHLYFSSNNTISYRVKGLQSWFRIDQYHADLYNLTALLEK